MKVTSFREFEIAVQEALKTQGPTAIEVPVDPDENRFHIQ